MVGAYHLVDDRPQLIDKVVDNQVPKCRLHEVGVELVLDLHTDLGAKALVGALAGSD